MADFNDITGWREEWEAWRLTDEGKAYLDKYGLGQGIVSPKIPYETIVQIAEQMLKHEEIRKAVVKHGWWQEFQKDYPTMSPEHPEWHRNPLDAHRTLTNFVEWFGMKTGCIFVRLKTSSARDVAWWALETADSDVYAQSVKEQARQVFPNMFDFDSGEKNND